MMVGSESQRVLISTNAGCTENSSSYITYFIYQENSFQVWTDFSAETWVDHKKVKRKNIAAHLPSEYFRSMFQHAFVLLMASKMPTYKNREKKSMLKK